MVATRFRAFLNGTGPYPGEPPEGYREVFRLSQQWALLPEEYSSRVMEAKQRDSNRHKVGAPSITGAGNCAAEAAALASSGVAMTGEAFSTLLNHTTALQTQFLGYLECANTDRDRPRAPRFDGPPPPRHYGRGWGGPPRHYGLRERMGRGERYSPRYENPDGTQARRRERCHNYHRGQRERNEEDLEGRPGSTEMRKLNEILTSMFPWWTDTRGQPSGSGQVPEVPATDTYDIPNDQPMIDDNGDVPMEYNGDQEVGRDFEEDASRM